jgi:hypothetical protein
MKNSRRTYLVLSDEQEVLHIFSEWQDFKNKLFPLTYPVGTKVYDVVVFEHAATTNGHTDVFDPPVCNRYKQVYFDIR